MTRRPPRSALFPYTALFRSALRAAAAAVLAGWQVAVVAPTTVLARQHLDTFRRRFAGADVRVEAMIRGADAPEGRAVRSEEHTSELQSRQYLVCRLLLENKT